MDRLKKAIACMKEVGKKLNVDSFEDKLVIQKTICLLELMGFKVGYSFSLYVRGPYSPDLTNDMYGHRAEVEGLRTNYELAKNEKQMLMQVSEVSDNLDPTMLEIMSTYAYFIKKGEISRDALTKLKKLKPFFSEAKIAVGVSRAKQLFPPSKEDTLRMKKEFAEVESAAVSDSKY